MKHSEIEVPNTASATSLYPVVISKLSVALSITVLAVSFVMPKDGVGFTICWFKNVFDIVCPGCGLIRSMSNISQGDISGSLHYHPFGVVLYPATVFVASTVLFSKKRKKILENFFIRYNILIKTVYWVLIGLFLTYGSYRMIL